MAVSPDWLKLGPGSAPFVGFGANCRQLDPLFSETLQIGRRCFQLRRFNQPQHLCGAVRKPHLPGGKSVHLFLEFTIEGIPGVQSAINKDVR